MVIDNVRGMSLFVHPDITETHPELGVVVATLSTGAVAPADKIGYTNVTNLMRFVSFIKTNNKISILLCKPCHEMDDVK